MRRCNERTLVSEIYQFTKQWFVECSILFCKCIKIAQSIKAFWKWLNSSIHYHFSVIDDRFSYLYRHSCSTRKTPLKPCFDEFIVIKSSLLYSQMKGANSTNFLMWEIAGNTKFIRYKLPDLPLLLLFYKWPYSVWYDHCLVIMKWSIWIETM